ncbi:hypothetical protein C8F04DRAFT_1188173 [Mycena alexandri]|uniref:Uncharacterized protein n=1 Tax=Mycena alexandri TaxID=1745969 RepID=A0AAD6X1L0_9AGAR|nr:hypothetical protein C8F04DRAFT_1188173 [Mycena alexandri]
MAPPAGISEVLFLFFLFFVAASGPAGRYSNRERIVMRRRVAGSGGWTTWVEMYCLCSLTFPNTNGRPANATTRMIKRGTVRLGAAHFGWTGSTATRPVMRASKRQTTPPPGDGPEVLNRRSALRCVSAPVSESPREQRIHSPSRRLAQTAEGEAETRTRTGAREEEERREEEEEETAKESALGRTARDQKKRERVRTATASRLALHHIAHRGAMWHAHRGGQGAARDRHSLYTGPTTTRSHAHGAHGQHPRRTPAAPLQTHWRRRPACMPERPRIQRMRWPSTA